MATFNKDKKEFSATCKKFIDTISEPITQFKASQKEIEKMYDDGRAKIADQVTKFEATKLNEIEKLISIYASEACTKRGFTATAISSKDLVMLSAVSTTKSGYTLTKKTTDAIDARIQAVENEILKARLEMEEKAKRDREIADKAREEAEERARQREIEAAIRVKREAEEALQRAERDKLQAVENERLRVEREERARFEEMNRKAVEEKQPTKQETVKQEPALLDEQPIVEDGKITHIIYARFEVPAPIGVDPQRIVSKIKSLIESAGITSLKSIEVQ
jgi:siroheme synthase (precorrin-2 oxidase/ferrochelatase)